MVPRMFYNIMMVLKSIVTLFQGVDTHNPLFILYNTDGKFL